MRNKYKIGDRFVYRTGTHQGVIISQGYGSYTVKWSDIGLSSADNSFLDQEDYEYHPCDATIIDKVLTKYLG
jgi:hypothetical protein